MNEQAMRYREAKIMEPIYRMYKVVEQQDDIKAKTLMAVTMQYIIEHYSGKSLQPADVQNVLRAVLLREQEGQWYAGYAFNEIQVKVMGWLTILAADLPVTLKTLGKLSDQLADGLQGKDFIRLSAEDVYRFVEKLVEPVDTALLNRYQLNRETYLSELKTFLVQ